MVSDNPIHALAIGVEIWVYVYVRDSPHSSQISHWLPFSSLWLLKSGPSSHICHCLNLLYKLLLKTAVSLKKWLQDFVSFGNLCMLHVPCAETALCMCILSYLD